MRLITSAGLILGYEKSILIKTRNTVSYINLFVNSDIPAVDYLFDYLLYVFDVVAMWTCYIVDTEE